MCVAVDDLIVLAKKYVDKSKFYIIIDDSLISKRYSKFIGGSGDNYNTTINQTYRLVCFITIMLTDGHYSLPLDHKIWIREISARITRENKASLAACSSAYGWALYNSNYV